MPGYQRFFSRVRRSSAAMTFSTRKKVFAQVTINIETAHETSLAPRVGEKALLIPYHYQSSHEHPSNQKLVPILLIVSLDFQVERQPRSQRRKKALETKLVKSCLKDV